MVGEGVLITFENLLITPKNVSRETIRIQSK